MASFYEMPSISPTMETGTLIEWRLKEGDAFTPQTVIAEVGTDKANMEAEVFDDGVLIKTLIEEGDEVAPGFPIAIIGQRADEPIDDLLAEFARMKEAQGSAAAEPTGDAAPSEVKPSEAPPKPEHSHRLEAPEAEPTPQAPPRPAAPPPDVQSIERAWQGKTLSSAFLDPPGDVRAAQPRLPRTAASPLARKVAADLGVALTRVQGTGPGGRIVRSDVEAAAAGGRGQPAPIPDDRVVRNSPMRKTIARRLLQSHQDIPTFFLTVVFDMTRMVHVREGLKDAAPDAKVSYNDLLLACVGRALRDFPEANASWGDKAIVRHGRVDVGMAVALDDGLITPVIRAADTKSPIEIAGETRDLASRARKGKLAEQEYTGGTFTLSNLGMLAIEEFTAIINPPESAILAVGAMQQVPVVVDGELTVGWRMKATMTCDHRVIDGLVGARFLQVLRRYVENPILLLI